MSHRAAPLCTSLRRFLFALLVFSLLGGALVACASQLPVVTDPVGDAPLAAAITPAPTPGLQFRLSGGSEQTATVELLPPAPATLLSVSDTQRLLDRLPPLTGAAGDVLELNLPSETLPAPRPGKTITQTFPPPPAPVAAPEVTTGPLEVVRYAPEGDVPLAPNLNVTFNQPMVALTGLSDLAAGPVPVKLSPQPEGQWRWVGTKTLVFEPAAKTGFAAGRFPAATKYTVEIPAGTTSATGNKLAQAVTFTFTTPTAAIEQAYPKEGPTRRDTPFFISFNQRIDPAAVLKTITVKSKGKSYGLSLLSEAAARDDVALSYLVGQAQEGRWLAFKTTEPLPADAQVDVTVGPGVPSAEGPLTSAKAETFTFRTYGPLRIMRTECGWGGTCRPFMPWQIQFNNTLDRASVTDAAVVIDPPLPAKSIDVYGNTIQIQGASAGQTTYRITLKASIRDEFGQTLGQDATVTVAVGPAEPAMQIPGGNFIVLDPLAKPSLSAYTINYTRLNVRAYAVTPDDWPAFKNYLRERYQGQPPIPGKQVYQKTVNVESAADRLTETFIDLEAAFAQSQGHLVVLVKPERIGLPALFGGNNRVEEAIIWAQQTQIGLDAFADAGQLLVWANDLKTGAPLANVELALWPGSQTARTGADGTATLPLPAGAPAQGLVARANAETAFLPANLYFWGDEGWQQRPLLDTLQWYVFDDRQMYKPGEEVHVKGWLRLWESGPRGDIALAPLAMENLTYRATDAQGNEIANGRADINPLGGFDLALKLPDNMNLGPANIIFYAPNPMGTDNATYGHTIQVQEFRRPEFEVTVNAGEGPYFVGESATAEVNASYYAGGPLPNAPVNWSVTSQAGQFSPPGWDDYTFGRWVPWWRLWWSDWEKPFVITSGKSFTGTTDAGGLHQLRIDFDAVTPPEPSAVHIEGTVEDVNRQAWTGKADLLVHPASLYVGLRTERMFVEKDERMPVDIIVTDLDGNAVPGVEVKLTAARIDWKWTGDSYEETEVNAQPCTVMSKTAPAQCVFETPEGGTYRIRAVINDGKGRPNQSELTRWVSGGERIPQRDVQQEDITLVPDKKEYRAGETAEILVQAPFVPAEGLLTLRRSGLLEKRRFTMNEPSIILRIPIQEGYVPNVWAQVDLVGASDRDGDQAADPNGPGRTDLPRRPAYARGEINLLVPPLARALTVDAQPAADKLEPGGTTELTVTVTDASGKPVPDAELAVAVVDESILALTGYDIPDPLTAFYSERSPDMMDQHNRGYIVLANPLTLETGEGRGAMANDAATGAGVMEKAVTQAAEAPAAAAPMAAATTAPAAAQPQLESEQQANTPIALRSDFNPLAHWSPAVPTGADGKAAVTITVPDNLTRYRVMVVAVAGGKQFGKGSSAVTARLPLMVRPSAPRFLNFGDRFELPVVVQNQTDEAMTVDVALRTANLALTEGNGRRVTVPANDRVEVRFPATTISSGTARFQAAAASGKWADAASGALPVYTPATTEAFATYGVIDEGAIAQPVIAPSDVFTQFGGLEITTSSTALQSLTDAFLYLVSYPYECSEQYASRILAVAALRDVLTAFRAQGLPPTAEIEASVARDIERLQGMQNGDGGFPIWKRGDESWPYHTIHVAHALQRAKMKGYAVPQGMLDAAQGYLRSIETKYPSWYNQSIRDTLTAYSLYVRNLMGDKDTATAKRLISTSGLDKLSPEAIGWLLSVLTDDAGSRQQVEQIRRHLLNRVTETAGAAYFAADYGDQDYVILYSNRRADGVILDALIGDQPDSDLIPKLVAGLLGGARAGRWNNTQENVFILLALDRYFNTYEAVTPDFIARAWLGQTYAGDVTFRGRTTDYKQIDVPMAVVAQQSGQQNIILQKEGPGRLYYRLGMRYAPRDLELPPLDAGFTVMRTYEAVDDLGDVTQDDNGDWIIKAGARVRVKLTMVNPALRHHVALADPLPAGFESLNPALATTATLPTDQNPSEPSPAGSARGYWWWWGPWYEHQNLRDQRAEAFATTLWPGVHDYSYIARATTPGRFVVPPAKAEEMYAPETFGRSAGNVVIVK